MLNRGHNAEYWTNKIQTNILRDRRRNRQLKAAGWQVVRIWESDIYERLECIVRNLQIALKA
jgi:DNA mismatch endonuclease (patch repair protein)